MAWQAALAGAANKMIDSIQTSAKQFKQMGGVTAEDLVPSSAKKVGGKIRDSVGTMKKTMEWRMP